MPEILIDPAGFKGSLALSSNTKKNIPLVAKQLNSPHGPKDYLAAQVEYENHWLDTGPAIDLSTIVFQFLSGMCIRNIQPGTSATAAKNVLTLITCKVAVSSGNYLGKYNISLLPLGENHDVDASDPANSQVEYSAIVNRTFQI